MLRVETVIPGSVYRRAKEIVAAKESPFKEWSAALRNTPGILDYSRASIFALIRSAHPEYYKNPGRLSGYISANLTESDHGKPTAETLAAARHNPEVSWESEVNEQIEVEKASLATQPQVTKLGDGMFTIDNLMNEKQTQNDDRSPVTAETSTDVQMETTQPEKIENTDPVQPGEGANAANTQAVTVAPEEQQSEPVIEYPAYFEPGRYEGLPNDVYHAANGISSTQVKDARVSLMYFNARHVAKTIPRTASKVLDMGNLVHVLALQPENLEAEFSVEPKIPEGAFTTTATLRELIDAYNASLPALLSADEIKALLEEHNASLPAPVPLGASLEETAQSYMALPAEYQRIEEGQKQTATAMKACI